MRGKTLAVAALAAALATTRPAVADNRVTGEAQELVKQGAAQYQEGDYARAAATLQQAYALKPAPRLLFNIARALEKAGNSSDSLTYYERYLESGETESDLVRKSQDAVDRLRPSVSEPTPAPPPPAPVSSPPPPPSPSHVTSKPPPQPRDGLPDEEPSHTLSWVLIGGGAAVAAAGVGVGIWANATASEEKGSTDPAVKPGLRDAAYARATIADVMMGVGVAAAATGVVLRFTAERRKTGLAVPSIRVGAASLSASWELGP
jgi:hypothetical protein